MTSTTIYQSTKTLPYVYRLDHPITGEFYIGYRSANKKPSSVDLPLYKTSSKAVKPRFDEFEWHIVAEFFDADAAYDFEQQLIFENWDSPMILNQHHEYGKGAMRYLLGRIGKPHSQETKNKISASNMGKMMSEESKSKLSKARTGYKATEETCRAISEGNKGLKRTPEQCKNIADGQRGNKRGPETGRRISAAITGKLKGMPKPEGFGERLSKATKGKPKSAEHIAAMSKATKGIPRSQKQSICPHCGRTGALNLLSRYHFNNCKLLATRI